MCQVSNRAVLAGELLAHVLLSGAHGGRPVTLIGYSMGARSGAPAMDQSVGCHPAWQFQACSKHIACITGSEELRSTSLSSSRSAASCSAPA